MMSAYTPTTAEPWQFSFRDTPMPVWSDNNGGPVTFEIWPNNTSGFVRSLARFQLLAETAEETRKRVSKERSRAYIRQAKLFAPPPLAEAMFDKPTFVRRACGGRWRVMLG